jgi:hypothetical protein
MFQMAMIYIRTITHKRELISCWSNVDFSDLFYYMKPDGSSVFVLIINP